MGGRTRRIRVLQMVSGGTRNGCAVDAGPRFEELDELSEGGLFS